MKCASFYCICSKKSNNRNHHYYPVLQAVWFTIHANEKQKGIYRFILLIISLIAVFLQR